MRAWICGFAVLPASPAVPEGVRLVADDGPDDRVLSWAFGVSAFGLALVGAWQLRRALVARSATAFAGAGLVILLALACVAVALLESDAFDLEVLAGPRPATRRF